MAEDSGHKTSLSVSTLTAQGKKEAAFCWPPPGPGSELVCVGHSQSAPIAPGGRLAQVYVAQKWLLSRWLRLRLPALLSCELAAQALPLQPQDQLQLADCNLHLYFHR